MADSPVTDSVGVLSFEITSEGTAIAETYSVYSIDIRKEVNRIATARIVLMDGTVKARGLASSHIGAGTSDVAYDQWQDMGLSDVKTVIESTTGNDGGCALTNSGTAKCWGSNSEGQVGDQTSGTTRDTPVDVLDINGNIATGITSLSRNRYRLGFVIDGWSYVVSKNSYSAVNGAPDMSMNAGECQQYSNAEGYTYHSLSNSLNPKGCLLIQSQSDVYYNSASTGTDCSSIKQCIQTAWLPTKPAGLSQYIPSMFYGPLASGSATSSAKVSKTCQACPAGYINDAMDDPSGLDTT